MQLTTMADRKMHAHTHTQIRGQSASQLSDCTEEVSGGVRVVEQEQADSLSILLTTRWMDQYLWEPQLYVPVYLHIV